jgi:hypothetical protein
VTAHRSASSGIRTLYQMARADFLERVRRYGFLVTLAMTLYLGYLAASGQIVMQLNHSRGVFNSAWIGALMALVATVFLSLAGFYVVKNTIERDRQTRVGQILASTPLSKLQYVLGKTVSNFAVLAAMVGILAASGIVMQFSQGEDPHVNLWKLFAPFLLIALPAMALVSALAVLFETIPWLRGGFGNVAYFFLWTAGLSIPMATSAGTLDWPGILTMRDSMFSAAGISPEQRSFSFSLDVGGPRGPLGTFQWDGLDWTAPIVAGRCIWIAVALVLVMLATLLFDRFDPARGRTLLDSVKSRSEEEPDAVPSLLAQPIVSLTPLAKRPAQFRFGAMLSAELRLMLKGQKWWWYAGALLLFVLAVALPSPQARGMALCVAWVWPVLLWSVMGVREKRDQTSQLLFCAPHPIARQLSAVWCAGVILAILTGGGFALRLLVEGDLRGLLPWLIGAIFIPTFALALGVWSGSSKPFEILYTLLWYVGPMHATVPLDFMGSQQQTAFTRVPLFYLALTAGMMLLALAGRKQQLQS